MYLISRWLVGGLCAATALLASSQASADPAALVAERCADCHAIEPVDYATLGSVERLERVAPPLYYAGNKYRRDWLVQWLQNPEPVYPSGYYREESVHVTADGDLLVAESEPHPALDAEQALAAAGHLMGLTPHQALVDAQSYDPGTVAMRMGMMDFRRFKGCGACHQDEPGRGGVSGPELHTAWERLQPGYLASYIDNPVAWDPHTMMPAVEYNTDAVHRLVDYLHTIGGSD